MSNKKITDITKYQCINTSKAFFLDTNVLYWYSHPRFSNNLEKRAEVYYNFVDSLVSAANPLYTSVYNLTELLNITEKNEYDIYIKTHPEEFNLSRKDFRRIIFEREKLKKLMQTTLNNVYNICTVLEFPFKKDVINKFTENLTTHRCDVFDYLIIQDCIQENYINIISDDNDFSTIDNINLYTANTISFPNIH